MSVQVTFNQIHVEVDILSGIAIAMDSYSAKYH
jgi:hypothetical protein